MTTLLTVGTSEGARRCDAKCHDASAQKCACVCGGRNHGVGHDRAVDNLRVGLDTVVKEFARKRGVQRAGLRVTVSLDVAQGQLFPLSEGT